MNMLILGTSVASVIKKTIASSTDNIDIQTFPSIGEFAKTAEMRNVPCDRLILTQEVLLGNTPEDKRDNLQQLYAFLESKYMDIVVITITKDEKDLRLCSDVFYSPNCVNICLSSKIKPAALQRLGNSTVDELNDFFAENTVAGFQKREEEALRAKVNNIESQGEFAISDEFQDAPQETPVTPQRQGLFGGIGRKREKEDMPDSDNFLSDFDDTSATVPNSPDYSEFESAGFEDEIGSLDFSDDEGDMESGSEEEDGFDDDFGGDFSGGEDEDDDFADSVDFSDNTDFDEPVAEEPEATESVGDFDFSSDDDFDDFDSSFDEAPAMPASAPTPKAPPQTMSAQDGFDDIDFTEFDNDEDVEVEQPVAVPPPRRSNPLRPNVKPPQSRRQASVPQQPADNIDTSDLGAYVAPTKPQSKSPLKKIQSRVNTQQNISVQAGVSRYQNIINGNTTAVIVLTGERRTGITRAALNTANLFSRAVPTLFVDMDIARHGSLYYLGLEDISDASTAVQNGLGLVKSGRDIKQYVYRSLKYKFDSLISMPGNTIKDADLSETISQLIFQSAVYRVIVIDCPLSSLYLVEELMYSADFFICTCSDICACSNLLFKLDNLQMEKAEAGKGISDKALALLHNRAKYIVNVTEAQNDVIRNMRYLEQVYGLSDDKFVWTQLPYAGTMDNLEGIMQNLM